ncbi:MAG: hypothetical protein ACK6AD_07860 [Cyanobacteriota bacterium]
MSPTGGAVARCRRGGNALGVATAPGVKTLDRIVCSEGCTGAGKLNTRSRPSALTRGRITPKPVTGVTFRLYIVPPPSRLMLCSPASGTASFCGPCGNTEGREVYSRPNQLLPWVVCSS